MGKNCKNCLDFKYQNDLFGKAICMCYATGEQKEDSSGTCELWRENKNIFSLKDFGELKKEILADLSTSFFVKEAIEKLEKRDVCDVLNDLEVLQSIYKLKLETMMGMDSYFVFKDKNN